MKKGDERRQAILNTAERLFFSKGYEDTSIQDILSDLKLSKGGFYHHFESKMQLLEAICLQRAQAACERGVEIMQGAGDDPVKRLNALFLSGGFFGEENVKYIALMLRTAYGGEVIQLRESIRRTSLEKFFPAVRDVLVDGMKKGVFYLRSPEGTARLLIMLACDVNDEVALITAKSQEESGDMAAICDLLETYRRAVELLVNAPYGSMELIDMVRMREVLRSLSLLGVRKPLDEDWNFSVQ